MVIGGSVAGLGVALALSSRGHRVTVLESDETPLPATAGEAFAHWNRKGSPQTRHSHALLARLRNLIRDHAPELREKLLAAGAEELHFTDRVRQLFEDPELRPEDDDLVFLACRRITFEWVLRRHVLDTGLVDFRDGVEVQGLESQRDAASGLPRVTGVRAGRRGEAPEVIRGDLVVDASGRRSRLRHWLPEIGTPEVREATSPCGIFYTSRFYRLLDGVTPPPLDGGIIGLDLGYIKVGVFTGDSRVFSITLAASPGDAVMRRILKQPAFDSAVAAIPLTAQWTSPEMAEPVSEVHGMANLNNTRRWLVEEGEPLALGFVAVGDSLIHTNPIVGRGCSFAWTAAFALADCLDAHGTDLRALALAYDARIVADIVPWYELQLMQDADSIEVAEDQQAGKDPFATSSPDGTQNPKAFIRSLLKEGLQPALMEDLPLLRRFVRTIHLLDQPGDLMRDPQVIQTLLRFYQTRDERRKHRKPEGPSRQEMVDRLAAA